MAFIDVLYGYAIHGTYVVRHRLTAINEYTAGRRRVHWAQETGDYRRSNRYKAADTGDGM